MANKRSKYSNNRQAIQDISNNLYEADSRNTKLIAQIQQERKTGRAARDKQEKAYEKLSKRNLRLEGIMLELIYVIESMGYAQHEMLEDARDYFGPDACERFIKLRINEGKQGGRTVRRNPITPLENQ